MTRPLPLLAATALALSLAACTAPEKEPGSAETASTAEVPPTIETLAAPRANVDLRWEEWAPVGAASAPAARAAAGLKASETCQTSNVDKVIATVRRNLDRVPERVTVLAPMEGGLG